MDDIGITPEIPFQPFKTAGRFEDGIRVVSTNRPFAHALDVYDAQVGVERPDPGPGFRLVDILGETGMMHGGNVLEVGCGTGQLSVGLVESDFFTRLVLTDGSMNFLNLIKQKIGLLQTESEVELALLTDSDVDQIADDTFDVIVMRSVLHHVVDFNGFADVLLSKLRKGGIFCLLEPRAEIFLWMGTVMAMFIPVAQAKGIMLDDGEKAHVERLVKTVEFYLRRDLDKSGGEDKFAFWITEMLEIANRRKFRTAYFSESSSPDLVELLLSYLRFCMAYPETLMEKISLGLADLRGALNSFLQGSAAPDLAGWFVMVKD